jgi:catechol 2,3-dioxygenase-like lactoylglutathione lyase family enzyme
MAITGNKQEFCISRRTVLGALSLLCVSPRLLAQNSAALRIQKINCFEIRVADVARTVAFYQDLFGMPVQSRVGDRVCLRVGEGPAFMAVRPLQAGETPAITHIGYSVENYDLEGAQTALQGRGFARIEAPALSAPGIENPMKMWVRMRGDTPELYFSDARGLIVQLSDSSYCGGSGELGNVCAAVEAPAAGMFKLDEINHFTAFVSNGAAANTFYQELFGLEVQSYQGPNSPVTGTGDGKQFVMYAGPFPGAGENSPANLNHGCFNMEGFDVDQILAKLTEYGLKARPEGTQAGPLMHYISRRMPERGGAEGGTPELYFTDPDGILMQLQDVTYCGGGGYLGNECLAG